MEPFWLFFGQGQRIWTGACGGICESPWGNDVFHLFGGGIVTYWLFNVHKKRGRMRKEPVDKIGKKWYNGSEIQEISRSVKKCRDWNDCSERVWGDKGD